MASPSLPPAPRPDAWRRLSTPTPHSPLESPAPGGSYLTLPTVSVSGLRAALLGYIGEAENALRERLGIAEDSLSNESVGSSPSPSSEDDTDYETTTATTTSALDTAASAGLRRRGPPAPSPGTRARITAAVSEADERIFENLRALREEIAAYVPAGFQMPVLGLQAQREWLKNLPAHLQTVDLGLSAAYGGAWQDPVSAPSRAVRSARRRVINLVHALLPPDDWQGWESLGWEEPDSGENTPRRPSHHKACSLDEKWEREVEDDDDGSDEPEYLFPNRTPAPAHAIARHKRYQQRSKSLSMADSERPTFSIDDWIYPMKASAVVDDEGEADDLVIDEFLRTKEAEEVKEEERPCDKHGVHAIPADVPTIAEALRRSENGKVLLRYTDMPFWWRNNQYIHTGYRFIPLGKGDGPIPLIKSAFKWHNETINIHSHFIPTLFILSCIPFIIWRTPLPDANWVDTAMMLSYLLAAMSCLSCSAGWHVLSGCASRRWFEWGACVDYIGISWLIAMSFNTVVYNAYYCRPRTVLIYTCINVAFGGLGSYLPFQKWFNQRKNKPWRILFFLCLNFAMIAPIVQLYHRVGVKAANAFVSPFYWSVVAYVSGLVCYAFHLPECLWPGKFDRYGASHNLWHTGIVIAIILHYRAVFVSFSMRWDYSCAAPDAQIPVPEAVTAFLFNSA